MTRRLILITLSIAVLFSACCGKNKALPHTLSQREMFGYSDEIALGAAIEKELAKRAFKKNLEEAGKPAKVALNDRFGGTATEKLVEIYEKTKQYGDNDNTDALLLRAPPANVQLNMESIAAVFVDTDLPSIAGTNAFEPARKTKLKDTGVCLTDKFLKNFLEQPADVALCTAFLIEEDVVVTAQHCASSDFDAQHKKFVFGYFVHGDGTVPASFTEVFAGKKVLGQSGTTFVDWAVVQLDGKVTSHKPLKLSTTDVAERQRLYMIGYPLGLPAKYAPNAEVIASDTAQDFFVANVDGFKTNSGSPIFDATTNEVVGVLYGGYKDRVWTGKCWIPSQCPQDGAGCTGELVARIKDLQYKK